MMERQITTSQVDASLGINACKAYEAGDYRKAQGYLLDILDIEPNNWLARFYLAVCYQKTNQAFAASRAFRFLYEKCPDEELRKKALHLMHQVNAGVQNKEKPSELGRYREWPGVGSI